jgi:nucleotide-binding universal stress UspA family protein
MKPVLLATDGSPTAEQALESAIDLARLLDTDLTVVTVWNIPYGVGGFGAPVVVDGELAKLSEEQARRVNAEAASRAEEAGVETRSLVLRGFPVEEICLAAKSVRAAAPRSRLARLGRRPARGVRERLDRRAPPCAVPGARGARRSARGGIHSQTRPGAGRGIG